MARKKIPAKKKVKVSALKKPLPQKKHSKKISPATESLTIYVDGSYRPPRFGSWAAVIISDTSNEVIETLSEKVYDTTIQRMELTAIIEGLKKAKLSGINKVSVYSDSSYAVNSMTAWIYTWVKSGWISPTGAPIKNRDLMEELYELIQEISVKVYKVKAHSGDKYNEMADAEAQKLTLEMKVEAFPNIKIKASGAVSKKGASTKSPAVPSIKPKAKKVGSPTRAPSTTVGFSPDKKFEFPRSLSDVMPSPYATIKFTRGDLGW